MVEISQYDISPFLNAFDDGVCCISTQGELLYANELAQKHWHLHQQHARKLLLLPPVIKALDGMCYNSTRQNALLTCWYKLLW